MDRLTDEELILDDLMIHKWEKQVNKGEPLLCDFWDCTHYNIGDGETYYFEEYPEGMGHTYCLECSAYFMAQATNKLFEYVTKSIKVDRQAMAEWLEQNYGLASMAWLIEALRTNKVPWEGEQDAVHTTRKTPRTIPPD